MSFRKLLAISSSLALIGILGFPPASHAAIVGGGVYPNANTTSGSGFAACDHIYVYNPLGNWVWLTIYTLDRVHILDSGPMGGNAAVTVEDSAILCGSFYEVRAQVMGGSNDNTVVCDTGAQVNPTLRSDLSGANVDTQVVTVENCYMGEGNASVPNALMQGF